MRSARTARWVLAATWLVSGVSAGSAGTPVNTGSAAISSPYMAAPASVSGSPALAEAPTAAPAPTAPAPTTSVIPAPAATQPVVAGPASAPILFSTSSCSGGCGSCCESCCNDCCQSCCPCGPPGRFWVDVEYLLWFTQGNSIPPLITAGPPGQPQAAAGVLGQPGTTVVYGNERINDDARSGVRVRGGFWLDCEHKIGVEFGGFFLGQSSDNASASGPGTPGSGVISRPFFNSNPAVNANAAELVAFPGIFAGTVHVGSTSDLGGGDATGRYNLCCGCNYRVDALAGYRYLHLADDLEIDENLTSLLTVQQAAMLLNAAIPQGTQFFVLDHFHTTNDFNGVNLGLAGEYRYCKWIFGARGTVALGDTHQTVTISGATKTITPDGNQATLPGGLLTQPSNIGSFSADYFSVVPEIGATVGYQLTPHIRVNAGYNFLYWSNVSRTGGVIDLNVDSRSVPRLVSGNLPASIPGLHPVPMNNQSDYWAQGFTAGLEIRY